MDYLLISGAPSTGKSDCLYEIGFYLINIRGFAVIDGTFPTTKFIRPNKIEDFICVLEGVDLTGATIKIILNAATDEPWFIYRLQKFYSQHFDTKFIITSARDIFDPMRLLLFQVLNISLRHDRIIEVPKAKITRIYWRANRIAVYNQTVFELACLTLSNLPFNV